MIKPAKLASTAANTIGAQHVQSRTITPWVAPTARATNTSGGDFMKGGREYENLLSNV